MSGEPDEPGSATGQEECMACRGTGSVISMLGGQRREVPCPWCRGSGRRAPRGGRAPDEPPDAA